MEESQRTCEANRHGKSKVSFFLKIAANTGIRIKTQGALLFDVSIIRHPNPAVQPLFFRHRNHVFIFVIVKIDRRNAVDHHRAVFRRSLHRLGRRRGRSNLAEGVEQIQASVVEGEDGDLVEVGSVM